MTRIYLSPPDVGERERRALEAAFLSGWVAPTGPDLDAFEAEVAAVGGRQHGAGLASGTAALHLGLKGLGVGPGDDVICSTFTFAATANAITYCGARPVFVDAEASTWNLSPDLLAEELSERAEAGRLPAAVIVVMVCLIAVIGLAGFFLGQQVSALSAEVPTYQTNMRLKLRAVSERLRAPGMFDGALKTFDAVKTEVETSAVDGSATMPRKGVQASPTRV